MAKTASAAATVASDSQEAAKKKLADQIRRKAARVTDMAMAVDPATEEYVVTLCGRTQVEIFGQLISVTDKFVIFRHRKERTQKLMLSRFMMKDVIMIVGEVGGPASIVVMRDVPFKAHNGRVAITKTGLMQVYDDAEGVTITINPYVDIPNFSLNVQAIEQTAAADADSDGDIEPAPAAKPRKPAAASAKPATTTTVAQFASRKQGGRAKPAAVVPDDSLVEPDFD